MDYTKLSYEGLEEVIADLTNEIDSLHGNDISNDRLATSLKKEIAIAEAELNRRRNSCSVSESDDPVNHPSHYTYGSIECIEYLDAIGIGYPFCKACVIKYTTRLGHKVDDLEDAKKAVWYAQHIVDKLADGTYTLG